MKSSAIIILTWGMVFCVEVQAQTPVTASPNWNRTMPAGSDVRVKITEEYAKLVGRPLTL